jgi:hypothetical protein
MSLVQMDSNDIPVPDPSEMLHQQVLVRGFRTEQVFRISIRTSSSFLKLKRNKETLQMYSKSTFVLEKERS